MRTAAKIVLLLCLAPLAARAQERPAHDSSGARLVDSFGAIQISDLLARLDHFAIQLLNEPAASGHFVAYAAKNDFPGWPLRRGSFALDYLVETRGLDRARLSLVNGGPRDRTGFEMWVVGPGAEPPFKPFDVSLLMSGEKAALPFDRFVVVESSDPAMAEMYEATPQPDSASMYEYFAEVLRRDPGLRGCVIGYTSWDGARAADRRVASRAKLTIAKSHAVDVSRLVALGGGRRRFKMVELWLVPPGARMPAPSPEPPPARRRRR